MKQQIISPSNTVPTANIGVNKSRIKIYQTKGEMPTYYLQKGQEFQIELVNPTKNVVMAKIILNGKLISQGGLVLNPGQRIWLDRYLDVAKKFLFDTYEVSNTNEMKKAIENNGDIKIEFYNERTINMPTSISTVTYINPNQWQNNLGNYHSGTPTDFLRGGGGITGLGGNAYYQNTLTSSNSLNASYSSDVSLDGLNNLQDMVKSSVSNAETTKKKSLSLQSFKKEKTIETGRVEKGSNSDQKFEYVNKSFDYFPFHTVEYKLLPISQKVNTIADINVKRYCTNCGAKLGKTDKFCASCGTKA